MAKRKGPKVPKGLRKTRNEDALFTLPDVEKLAAEYGIEIRVSKIGKFARHVMFNRADDRARLLNFWPSTGTWRTENGRTGKTDSIENALLLAVEENLNYPGDVAEMNRHLAAIREEWVI